jgi:hypothetical protein
VGLEPGAGRARVGVARHQLDLRHRDRHRLAGEPFTRLRLLAILLSAAAVPLLRLA